MASKANSYPSNSKSTKKNLYQWQW